MADCACGFLLLEPFEYTVVDETLVERLLVADAVEEIEVEIAGLQVLKRSLEDGLGTLEGGGRAPGSVRHLCGEEI